MNKQLKNSINIPNDYIEFLHWIKERTESYWGGASADTESLIYPDDKEYAEIKPPTYEFDYLKCDDWLAGAKWQGLTDTEIRQAEKKFDVKFTWQHREFLKVLHTIDKKEHLEIDEGQVIIRSYFHDWLTDDETIFEMLKWRQECIEQYGLWLKSWGEKPQDNALAKDIFIKWYESVPSLTPICGHRFVVGKPAEISTVLSIASSDAIVYGGSMRDYLLREIGCYNLGLGQLYFDKEWKVWQCCSYETIMKALNQEKRQAETREIPVYGEMLDFFWDESYKT